MRLLFIFLLVSFKINAQSRYFVYLKDKAGSQHSINKPAAFLSQKSIDRRTHQGITITEKDLPVSDTYLNQIQQTGFNVIGTSKWLNAVLVSGSSANYQKLINLPFVSGIENNADIRGAQSNNTSSRSKSKFSTSVTPGPYDYGLATNQIKMLGADTMHTRGYTGKGILIAVIDAGFMNVNTASAFSHLISQNKIIDTYNFVFNTTDVFRDHNHGTNVLSTISARIPGSIIGTAPDADVALYITEDIPTESRQESVYWVFAAERADSLGVDIINTSLGYYNFDDPSQNYTYKDMDGKTTLIAKAATYAAETGIVMVNSAGNEGANSWKYVDTPADSKNVIAVGSVNQSRIRAITSSQGPSSDDRIKPDVSAMGANTIVSNRGNEVNIESGTSFAAPLIAGFIAGIKQQFPKLTAFQLKELVTRSADRFSNPDNLYGYGIPSYTRFLNIIGEELVLENEINNNHITFFPNPISGNQKPQLQVNGELLSENQSISLIDNSGKVLQDKIPLKNLSFSELASGTYIIKFRYNNLNYSKKVMVSK